MKIAIAGSAGRMGRTLIEAVCASEDLKLTAALEIARSPALGKDAGETLGIASGVAVSADYAAGIAAADCLIDFTRPEGSLLHLEACVQSGTKMVIGTTGFSAQEKARIVDAAKRIAQELIVRDKVQFLTGVVWTPNAAAIAPLTAEAKLYDGLVPRPLSRFTLKVGLTAAAGGGAAAACAAGAGTEVAGTWAETGGVVGTSASTFCVSSSRLA